MDATPVMDTVPVEDTGPVTDDAGAAALSRRRVLVGWGTALVGPVVLTATLQGLHRHLAGTALHAMLYLSLAVAVALIGGRWPALAAAVLGALLLNFFFIPPRHTLTVPSG